MYSLRTYREKDWKIILDIFLRAKSDEMRDSCSVEDIVPLDKDEGLFRSFRNSTIIIAEYEGKVIGYAGYESNSLVSFLFVDPSYYQRGIGTKLLTRVVSEVGEKAWLLVAKNNVPAIKLYYKHGFRRVQEFIGKYNGIDISVLRLALTPELQSWRHR
ncbi:GCN5-related N-acetyltransferase [Alkaliphilus metalliredigens QYMF]|uniref:GCN5-related N-acetyltransferase n=1 Tax=Alkaliphilus metalliredigens (strain QYMF) TaxID=293826 RepID=A6TN51_ALKMQ|nr:GNAT family N-acetyltransferase [Alkaliphilus metalliredigens]ABR47619.1 GCN5-related N-acetyltransferase [Alkaliphilus metalliredigens QYMF]